MCTVNTLQNLCAKMCVENKSILKHPVNISDIPLHIYEDLWNLTAIKDLEERKNYLGWRIDNLEDEWLDTDEKAEFYKDIWGQLSEGLKAINAPPTLARLLPTPKVPGSKLGILGWKEEILQSAFTLKRAHRAETGFTNIE